VSDAGPPGPITLSTLLRRRVGDSHPALVFEERTWSYDAFVHEAAVRAALFDTLHDPDRPLHVGVLLDNVPEYLFWASGAGLAGATIVGINPTRRGDELARDVRHTDCQLIITDRDHIDLLDGLDLGIPDHRVLLIDNAEYDALIQIHRDARLPDSEPDPARTLFLLFTSGSTSAPKAVICSNERMAMAGVRASEIYGVTRSDVCYSPMPLFHGNALMACWSPALAQGATLVLRRRFSASGFLDDVRKYHCTYFTYVGRTIAYILAQPPSGDDRNHALRIGFGTEASALDRERFEERFGCRLIEGYGSSESVVVITRTPQTPPNALGVPRPGGGDIAVVDPVTMAECARARFGEHGELLNGHDAIGEIVNRSGGGAFEGYYNNAEATSDRIRNGWYFTGDLAYVDEAGFFYFAGRSADWLRVDSENFAAAPVENILHRFPGVVMAAVYAVPDPVTGDQVMAALEMTPGTAFDPDAFARFLAEQRDLGTKWAPRLVRIVDSMPLTANNKVHKPPLRQHAWNTDDPIWWRPAGGGRPETSTSFRLFAAADRTALEAEFDANGRANLLPARSSPRQPMSDDR
jgi:fatty-acyl-CoA synthase